MQSEQIRQAITEGNLDQVKYFIRNKAIDIEERFTTYNNTTIWHIAAESKSEQHLAILKLLLQTYKYQLTPTILNQREQNDLTPIHYAALVGNLEAIRLLVGYGADPTLTTDQYADVFFMMKRRGYGNLEFKLQAIIDNREQLEHEIWQSEPTQLEEFDKSTNSIGNKVTGLAKNIFSFFQKLPSLLERKKHIKTHNESATYSSTESKKIR